MNVQNVTKQQWGNAEYYKIIAGQCTHNSTTAQQHNSTTAQQHNSTTAQQHNSTTAQQRGKCTRRR